MNSKHVEAHFNMGVLHHTLDNIEEAISSYEKALDLDPMHYDALSNLGSARHKQQDLDGAIDAYQRALEIVQGMDQSLVDQSQISMLYYLLGAALSSLPSHRCKNIPVSPCTLAPRALSACFALASALAFHLLCACFAVWARRW